VVRCYRDLLAWQKSIELVAAVYRDTQAFPSQETYGLISQMRRAAISVPSNIAEGHARTSTGEFRQFLGHALGSLMELETQLVISGRLGYIDATKSRDLLERSAEIGRLVNGLLRSLGKRATGPPAA
jgi:four helix bundle protein